MFAEIVDLGAASLDDETNAVTYQAKGPTSGEGDDGPDYGSAPVFSCLGVTSLPAPATPDGENAQGVCIEVPGLDGVIVGARDTRTADVVAKLAPGETCLHSTGDGFDSRVFCKDGILAMVVGDDVVFSLDRKNQKVSLAAFGHAFQITPTDGLVATDETGKASIQLKNGLCILTGIVILGGRTPAAPVIAGVSAPGAPMPGVFIGS